MTGDELQAVVAAMTKRPWRLGANAIYRAHPLVMCGERELAMVRATVDAAAIVALANHAAALVELVKACEAWDDEIRHGDVSAMMDRIVAVRAALAAVHEVSHG